MDATQQPTGALVNKTSIDLESLSVVEPTTCTSIATSSALLRLTTRRSPPPTSRPPNGPHLSTGNTTTVEQTMLQLKMTTTTTSPISNKVEDTVKGTSHELN